MYLYLAVCLYLCHRNLSDQADNMCRQLDEAAAAVAASAAVDVIVAATYVATTVAAAASISVAVYEARRHLGNAAAATPNELARRLKINSVLPRHAHCCMCGKLLRNGSYTHTPPPSRHTHTHAYSHMCFAFAFIHKVEADARKARAG